MSNSDEIKKPSIDLPPDVLAVIKEHFTSQGNSLKRIAPHAYYNAENAIRVKIILENVVKTKQPYKIVAQNSSPNSLRQQWYEGARYLRDKLDPEKHYAKLYNNVRCRAGFDYIEVVPKLIMRAELLAIAPTAEGLADAKWRDDYRAWLDSDPELTSKFHRKNIVLADSDIAWAREQLAGVESLYLAKFERTEILVIRFNHDT